MSTSLIAFSLLGRYGASPLVMSPASVKAKRSSFLRSFSKFVHANAVKPFSVEIRVEHSVVSRFWILLLLIKVSMSLLKRISTQMNQSRSLTVFSAHFREAMSSTLLQQGAGWWFVVANSSISRIHPPMSLYFELAKFVEMVRSCFSLYSGEMSVFGTGTQTSRWMITGTAINSTSQCKCGAVSSRHCSWCGASSGFSFRDNNCSDNAVGVSLVGAIWAAQKRRSNLAFCDPLLWVLCCPGMHSLHRSNVVGHFEVVNCTTSNTGFFNMGNSE